jgi:gluconate 2-dehydrogenase gamma chain
MNRREFLQCAAVIAAGSSALPSSWVFSQEQRTMLAAQPNYIDRHPLTLFDDAQRALVTAVAEQVIPATDTPGAIDAGVPRFIELMVSDWFNETERGLFLAGVAELQSRAAGDFAGVPSEQQLLLLEAMEAEAADSDWYDLGNVLRVWVSDAPFICQFKELVVLGFMLSEVGGTRFQRENPMGSFDGSRPLTDIDPAWAAESPIRMIAGEINL